MGTKKINLKPEQFLDLLENTTRGVGSLVVMTARDWESIVAAYDSPLIKRIATDLLRVFPARAVYSKERSYTVEKNDRD